MAHQKSGKVARPQIHADALGLQRFGRALPVHRYQTGKTTVGLEEAHRDLHISPAEFDEVAAELGRTLDFFKVPQREKGEVLSAFAAHKDEVTAGYVAAKPR